MYPILLFCLLFSHSLLALTFGPFTSISSTVSPIGMNGNPPRLAVSTNGTAFAAWVNNTTNVSTIQAAFFNGTSWTAYNVASSANAPQIGIDQNGNSFILWVTSTSQIFATVFNATTGTFSTPLQLSTQGTFNASPLLAVSPSGAAVAIWLQNNIQAVSTSYSTTSGWSGVLTTVPFLPAGFGLDSSNKGFAIIDSFSGIPQGDIQVSRIAIP